jgi:hypothetical protein
MAAHLVWDQGVAGSSPVIPTNFKNTFMAFVILKETFMTNQKLTILVNDSEGIPMEFETFEQADKIAKLFESNSLTGNKYKVKKLS